MIKRSFIIGALLIAGCAGIYWFKIYTKTPKAAYSSLNRAQNKLQVNLRVLQDKKNIVPVVVIGSGPAGLSAALYTARASLYTLVFQGAKPGGQLTTTTYVENWPGTKKMLGSELIDQTRTQAETFGALIVNGSIKAVDLSSWPFVLTTDEGTKLYALTVIIATGAEPRLLGVPGEKEYWGYGVTTCAVCDAPYFKDKDVVVVGGGDSAVEQATLLASYAKTVTMLVRGDKMRAAPIMQQRLAGIPKITVLYSTQITKIVGQTQPTKQVTAVELINAKTKQTACKPVNGVFLAIGHEPTTQLFKPYVAVDQEEYITLATRTQQTTVPGVYAAGDVADKVYRQAGVAAGDGIKAALDATKFLQEHGFTDVYAQKIEKKYYIPEQQKAGIALKKIVTEKDLAALAGKDKLIVIDVGAAYCAACRPLLPLVESAAAYYAGKAEFAYIDLATNPKELVKLFDITHIPQLLFVKNNSILKRVDHPTATKQAVYKIISDVIASQ